MPSSLLLGFDIISPSKSITLSAPITIAFGFLLLILFAFNSDKFLEIISGLAFSLIRLSLNISSSIFEGITHN